MLSLLVCDVADRPVLRSNQLKISHQDQRGLKSIDLPRPTPESAAGGATSTLSADQHSGGGVAEASRSVDRMRLNSGSSRGQPSAEEVRLDEKVLHCAWHPVSNTVAVAGKAGLCLYKV